MQPTHNNEPDSGATRIFRMPSSDATSPDLMGDATPANPSLVIVKGPQMGSNFELTDSIVTIGRDPSNSVFLNDMTVSRHHARVDLSGISSGFATVEDLGSLNGTWVDGAIVNKAMLKDGSTIQIGTFRMVFHTNQRPTRIETGN
ncbi:MULTISPECIES: FHA domain-containing protein [Atopobiaceae]|uniref:Inner membrane component of T3SS domain-containing protein n=1 Tax=Parafannyhessea umbonata TaxID=604330 RepID=A0A1H9QKG8_9ACTN|nr:MULTISPECIES: FHA domain-containing protein [Atopobiaceae]SEH61040.1 Inner membrane component of T3SS domain-containing protein [Parafannyhessea umbonata]SER60359.1 Inner membrane component of T3SS domain-containing protein [Parafannyhessea umbonata]SJZ80558.1 FHA domain-containing protein [Olsenella sp. KH1P3]